MPTLRSQISISLDGYIAGSNQSPDDPLGEGGERLHEWGTQTESWRRQHGLEGGERGVDSDVAHEFTQGVGAYIMGRASRCRCRAARRSTS